MYISDLQTLLRERGHESHWLSIVRSDNEFKVARQGGREWQLANIHAVCSFLDSYILQNDIDIINIHSLFEPTIISYCLQIKPVIKFCHSPVMVCPGRDKFWRKSERICDIKYGLHCFRHIYSEGCANRHPARVVKAWKYVNFEIKNAAKRYGKIIVMSDYMQNGLLECGVPLEQIDVNPYFTNLSHRENVNQRATKKNILYAGRLISSKGPHILLEAIADTLRSNSDVSLDIIGDGNMRQELENKVSILGLSDKVMFHGWKGREQIKVLMENCYVFALPSIYPEAFGIVGIEAMACSKPVVAYNVGGVSTWLRNNKTGFLIERGDRLEFRTAIENLINDPVLYRSMSNAAYDEALRRFTPDTHMARLISIFESCIHYPRRSV